MLFNRNQKKETLWFLRENILFAAMLIISGLTAYGQFPEAPLRLAWDRGSCGYVDSLTGKLVIPYKYGEGTKFYKGLAITKDKKGNYGIIDIKGKAVFPHSCRYIEFNRENEIYIAEQAGTRKTGVLDCNLKQLLPFEYESIKFIGKVMLVKKWYTLNGEFNDYFGFFRPSGECIVPVEITHEPYQVREFMGNGYDGKKGLVNTVTGELTLPFIYRNVSVCPDSAAIVAVDDDGKSFLFDLAGKKMTETAFDEIGCSISGFFPVRLNGKWGFFRDGFTTPIAYDFDRSTKDIDFADGTFILTKDKKQGVAGVTGNEIVAFAYDKVRRYTLDFYIVEKNGRSGIVNSKGKTVVPCEFKEIPMQPGTGGFVLEDDYGNLGAYNENGEKTIPFIVNEGLVLNNYAMAEKYIPLLLASAPGHPKINYLAALGYYTTKKPSEALPLISKLIDNCGRNNAYPLLFLRAKLYADMNDFGNAETDARGATDMTSPWRTRAFIYMGDKKFKQQDFKKAEEYYTYAGLFYKNREADSLRLLAIEELKKRGQWNPAPSGLRLEEPVASLPVTIMNFTADDRMEYAGDYQFRRLFSWSEAVSGCPKGYRIPRLDDWLKLINMIMKEQNISEKEAYRIIDHIGTGWKKTYYIEKVLRSTTYQVRSENRYNLNISPLRTHFYTIGIDEFRESHDIIEYWFEPAVYEGREVNTISFSNEGFQFFHHDTEKNCVRYVKLP